MSGQYFILRERGLSGVSWLPIEKALLPLRVAFRGDKLLESWTVNNFKSFRGRTALSLRPLTLICGANSSGKSTILQSMLLIKQTVQHAPHIRPIALNGPLVRLGTLSDIENSQSKKTQKDHSVGIGWRIKKAPRLAAPGDVTNIFDEEIDTVSTVFEFDALQEKKYRESAELQPSLKVSSFLASYNDSFGAKHQMNLDIERNSGGRKLLYKTSILDDSADIFAYRIKDIDSETRYRALESRPNSRIAGCLIKHFMPVDIVIRYDRGREAARLFTQFVASNKPILSRRISSLNMTVDMNTRRRLIQVTDAIAADSQKAGLLTSRLADSKKFSALLKQEGELSAGEVVRLLLDINPVTRRMIRDRMAQSAKEIEHDIYNSIGADLTITPVKLDILGEAARLTDNYFRFAVRYLGPLRDEPRPLYPLQALASPTDVGPKGELTAAVLHLNEKRDVPYVPSSNFISDQVTAEVRSVKLQHAVEDWLSYLKVAVAFETSEKGKFGHELRVKTTADGEFQDLTNVGVGVSQLLPIVVTCLLAPRGATIILEQPELHLHPAVQARLADFFISMSLLGKQCIIETHGEHLIERIRFRIVSDLSDKIIKDTAIYSFKQIQGETKCTQVPLSRYGAIEDWPDDFFDQSQKEAEKIIIKALERRRSDVKSDSRNSQS